MNITTVVTVVTMSPSALTDFLPLFWLCLLNAIKRFIYGTCKK